jgi:dihydroceramidase
MSIAPKWRARVGAGSLVRVSGMGSEGPYGFWQEAFRGGASSVDWCEPNYVHSRLVAETWNSLSSLPLVALGLYGAWNARRQGLSTRFVLAFASLAVVGLGSTAFHATMLRVAQAADELPMIYATLIFLYCLRFRESAGVDAQGELSSMRRWRFGLGAASLLFTIVYFVEVEQFAPFIVTFTVATAAVTLWGLRVAFLRPAPRVYRGFLGFSAGAMVGGFFLFWIPEHVLLACDHPLQALHLHSWFHLLATASGYTLALWLAYHSLLIGRRAPRIELGPLLPRLRATLPSA